MAQNENISLSLGDRIDVLNKSQSLDARYGVYDSESEALLSMDSYGLDGRLVAVYTDKINGKVKVYTYNQVLHQLDPIDDQSLALTLEQARTNDNTVEGVILGSGEFDKEGNRNAFIQLSDLEDALENYIPLSGTEVGKPLTGEIEVDMNSTGYAGFKEEDGTLTRRIGMTDDGFNAIQTTSDDSNTYFEQGEQFNSLSTRKSTTSEDSRIVNTPQSTTITTIDADGNKAEIVVGEYGTVTFNSDIPGDDWSGYMFYNFEEGLMLGDNNSNNYNNLRVGGIYGQYNTNIWRITKDYNDSSNSQLLLPDSGPANRRIPVSVNGNYANQQGDIELEICGGTSDDISNESTVTGTTVTEALDELQEQLGALVNLTNDDNTLIIDGNIIRLNVTNITEEFTANGVDRNFEMTNVYTSIENVFINGVRIKSSDYITISEQEIEIKTTVTLLLGDEVVIQGTMFIEQ